MDLVQLLIELLGWLLFRRKRRNTIVETQAQMLIDDAMFKGLKRIAPETDPDALNPTEDVRRTLNIDADDFQMFLTGLSEELGVEIPESDYKMLVSKANIVEYLMPRVVVQAA